MASTKDYLNYILEQASSINLTFKKMMGENLLYLNGTLIGGIYDDRLLVKKVESNKKYNMKESIPYDGAKPMYLVDNIEMLEKIVLDTYKDLQMK